MNYYVRDARKEEVFKLAERSRLVLLESTYAHMAFDANKTANYLYDAILKRPNWFLRVIAEQDTDEVIGGLLCYCEASLFGPDKVAYDITIMITKEHRGKCLRQLIQVIEEYKYWATLQGARIIKIGVSSGINIEKAERFLERIGFTKMGSMHGVVI
jgi:hypothetical protein